MPTELQKSGKFRNHLFRLLRWEDLDIEYIRQLILLAQEEDLEGSGLDAIPASPGDVTTNILGSDEVSRAKLIARVPLVACGLPLMPLVLDAYGEGCSFRPYVEEGVPVEKGEVMGAVEGPASVLLKSERVMLNFLQHLSGIATQTTRYVELLNWSNTKLLDTRKTTPGLRVLEKYAVAQGGAWNHRMGLFDRVLIKDNHLAGRRWDRGSALSEAVRMARLRNPELAIEVEVDRLDQIPPALNAEADVILLDNFSVSDLAEAVALIGGRAYTEASGGITHDTLPQLSSIGLDFISCGALIHQSVWMDIGLDWDE